MPPAADPDGGVDDSERGGDDGPTETDSVPVIEGHAVWFNEYRY
jgi:hypothetical protein